MAVRGADPASGYAGSRVTVYGASAPYYVYGQGGGDAYGEDPIGGPEHVGDGGPGATLGSTFRGFTSEEVRRASGWPAY